MVKCQQITTTEVTSLDMICFLRIPRMGVLAFVARIADADSSWVLAQVNREHQ